MIARKRTTLTNIHDEQYRQALTLLSIQLKLDDLELRLISLGIVIKQLDDPDAVITVKGKRHVKRTDPA